ncbi:tetratricopeptide repeat protein [Vulgatibacter sp.]|uniref:tetratricopeptide repeat protein n=1 Tax=Vulgatibacter sp. TaxID=1971226 RepID=UPI003566276B
MKVSSLALATVAAALLSGCAHGGAASEAELAGLREQVTRLRQDREKDRRRLEALEVQLAAVARRQQQEKQKPPAPNSARSAPADLSVVRLAPPAPAPAPAAPVEEEDSFVFIVDRGDGDEGAAGTSRPLRQARRGMGGPAGGVDTAPPIPTAIELQDPTEPAAGSDRYDAGLDAITRGDLPAAVAELEAFLAAHPRDRRADNAVLALGDVFRQQQMPGRALQQWERVATDYPAGDAVPDALLRYGETCRELGRSAASRAAFERLVQNYPGTQAATRAGAYLAEGK